MPKILDILLQKGISFDIRGTSEKDGLEMYYRITDRVSNKDKVVFTIKERYTLYREPMFDLYDFSCDPSIEIQGLTYEEIGAKIDQIAAALLFDDII